LDAVDAPEQAAQVVAARASVEQMDLVEHQRAQRDKEARPPRQQRIGGLRRRHQGGRRALGGDRSGVAGLEPQLHPQLRERRREALVQVACQRLGRADVQDRQSLRRRMPGDVALQERRDDRFGFSPIATIRSSSLRSS
jgi:hypothetical protein